MVRSVTNQSPREAIATTEQRLRDLIHARMTAVKGPTWEQSGEVWDEDAQRAMRARQSEEQKSRRGNPRSNRLLDYSELRELRTIIERRWGDFAAVFVSREKTISFLKILEEFRRPEMHSRSGEASWERDLCVGICGSLVHDIDTWFEGYRAPILSYECNLQFSASLDGQDAATADALARREADEWLARVRSATKATLEGGASGEGVSEAKYLLRLVGAHASVEMTWGHEGYGPGRFRYVTVTHRTSQASALDRILRAGGHPYWVMSWWIKTDPSDIPVPQQDRRIATVDGKTFRVSVLGIWGSDVRLSIICEVDDGQGFRPIKPSRSRTCCRSFTDKCLRRGS